MTGQRAWHRRRTCLILFLAIAVAFADILFPLMVTGRFFAAMMALVAGMLSLAFLQFWIWGWPREGNQWPARRDAIHFPR